MELIEPTIIVMLHPDYQYDPKLITAIIEKILQGADIVLASRMMKGLEAVKNGMPLYKYLCNRVLTKFQNFCFKKHLSEYHTGYRAYRKDVLKSIMYHDFSNDFKDKIANSNTEIHVILSSENGHDEIIGFGHENLKLTHPTDIVCRTSDYTCDRTLMIKANKAARDLNPNLIDDLKNEKEMKVVIKLI